METRATSTIAALCYKKQIDLEFSALVSEFDSALHGNHCQQIEMPDNSGALVTFTLGETLICLAHTRKAPGTAPHGTAKYSSSIVISVGSTQQAAGTGPLFDKRWELCGSLIGRVEELCPSDHDIWVEIQDVFTKEVYDRFVTTLWTQQAIATKFAAGQWPYLNPDQILPDLDRRLVDEFTRAGTPRPETSDDNIFRQVEETQLPQPSQACDVTPSDSTSQDIVIAPTHPALHADKPKRLERPRIQLPAAPHMKTDATTDTAVAIVPTHPALHADRPRRRTRPGPEIGQDMSDALTDHAFAPNNLHIYREALYPPEDLLVPSPRDNPLPQRLTIYTMNITLIVIAAPVGAAMMTYCILGRENMNSVARAMALTGTAIGLSKAGLMASLLPLLG